MPATPSEISNRPRSKGTLFQASCFSLLQHELHVVDHGVVPAEDLIHVQPLRLSLGDGRGHVAVAAEDERNRIRMALVVVLPRRQPAGAVFLRVRGEAILNESSLCLLRF